MSANLKLFNSLAVVLFALVVVLGGSYVYSAFFEEPYLSYKGMPFHVTGPVYAGGPALGVIQRCSSASTTQAYSTSRGFQKMGANQPPTILPSTDITVEPGCEGSNSRINIVPEGTQPGWYRFFGVANVRGLFVTHEVRWDTDLFEVIKKPAQQADIVLHTESKDITVEVKP